MSKIESDQSDSDNDQIINTGVLSVFCIRSRLEEDKQIPQQMFLKLKQSLTCPICLDIFNEPVYIKDCSHRFCKSCIEKYIRSQERKSCPTCRRKIGTKRQLRIDENIQFLMQTVFGNVELYIQLEDQLRKEQLEQLRHTNQNPPLLTTLKRQRSAKFDEDNKNAPGRRGRKKVYHEQLIGQIKDDNILVPPESQEEIEIKEENKQFKQEQECHEDETFQKLKNIIDIGTPITITIQLHTHPDSVWLPQIQQNVIRGPWTITTDNLSVVICKHMNLDEINTKYIRYFISQNEKFEPVQSGTTLQFLENNYWKFYRDAELYDPVDILKKIVEKEKLKDGSERRLYYNIDLECFE